MLFLSDNVKEVEAAAAAGMQSIMVDRPGNAPISDADLKRLRLIRSFDDIKLQQKGEVSEQKITESPRRRSRRIKDQSGEDA